MEAGKDTYYSHFSAFILGAVLTSIFFMGATSDIDRPIKNVEVDRAKTLAGAVFYADAIENDIFSLSFDSGSFAFLTTTTTSATTSTTTDESATTTLQYGSGEIFVEEVVSVPQMQKIVEKIIIPVEEVKTEEPVSNEEKVLPEGVYVLANGEYVDKNGDKISGDPYMYNYKPPQEEEKFETPGGIIFDRFGNIIFKPEIIDKSLVLIPPTIIDLNNLPSNISPIYIPRLVTLAISQNQLLTCTEIQLFGNDRALCELYKTYNDEYTWIRVDVEE